LFSKEASDQNGEIQQGMEFPVKTAESTSGVLIGHDDADSEHDGQTLQRTTEPMGNEQQSRNQPSQTENRDANATYSKKNGAAVEAHPQLLSKSNAGGQQQVVGSSNNVTLPSELKLASLATSKSPLKISNTSDSVENGMTEINQNAPQLRTLGENKNISKYSTSHESEITKQQILAIESSNAGKNSTNNETFLKSTANNTSANSNSEGTEAESSTYSAADFRNGNGTNSINSSSTDDSDNSEDADAPKDSDSSTTEGDLPTTEYKFEEEVPNYDGVDENGQPVNCSHFILDGLLICPFNYLENYSTTCYMQPI
jgi:hypothetical protein